MSLLCDAILLESIPPVFAVEIRSSTTKSWFVPFAIENLCVFRIGNNCIDGIGKGYRHYATRIGGIGNSVYTDPSIWSVALVRSCESLLSSSFPHLEKVGTKVGTTPSTAVRQRIMATTDVSRM